LRLEHRFLGQILSWFFLVVGQVILLFAMSFFGKTGPLVVTVMWTETIAALVFVLARLYTRARIVRSIGWDDHLIAVSMVSSTFLSSHPQTLMEIHSFSSSDTQFCAPLQQLMALDPISTILAYHKQLKQSNGKSQGRPSTLLQL
jgi:hypothetical protein